MRALGLRILTVGLWIGTLVHAMAQEPSQKLDFFESKIRPVLVDRCYECHSAAASILQGNLSLETRQGILSGGDSGPAVVPGKPHESLLIRVLRDQEPKMPPDGNLPEGIVKDFERWIEDGLVDPRDSEPESAKGTKKNWIDPADQKRPPEAGENRRIEAVVSPEQDGKHERCEGVGNQKGGELKVDRAVSGLRQNNFDDSELRQKNSENHAEAGIREHRLGVVDPELRHGGYKNQEAEEEFLGRFLLDARENQPCQSYHEGGENDRPHKPSGFKGFKKFALLDRAAALAAIATLIDQAPALKKSEHVCANSNGDWREDQERFQIRLSRDPRCSL